MFSRNRSDNGLKPDLHRLPPAQLPQPPTPPVAEKPTSFFTPDTVFAISATALSCGLSLLVWKNISRGLTRFRTADDIIASQFGLQTRLRARVASVGDGDNFRAYHLPWLRRWFDNGLVKDGKLSKETIHVRLAGVDAPECEHFGIPGQPYGPDALLHLRKMLDGKYVWIQPLKRDQYSRIVGLVTYKPYWFWVRRNVSLQLVRDGYAVVYTAGGAEYGSEAFKQSLIAAEEKARREKKGMWDGSKGPVELPGDFKRRMKESANSTAKPVGDPPVSPETTAKSS